MRLADFAATFESEYGPLTEREWLHSMDPWRMLSRLLYRHAVGHGKFLRLLGEFGRQFPGVWPQGPEVEPPQVHHWELPIPDSGVSFVPSALREFCTVTAAGAPEGAARVSDPDAFCDWLCGLLRELGGNPFHPPDIKPSVLSWNDGTVVKLARAADETQRQTGGHLDRDLLAVLADALEDAGCTDTELVGHLRGPGPHWRGCWAVDALLGKS
jgi:hypothetical protein